MPMAIRIGNGSVQTGSVTILLLNKKITGAIIFGAPCNPFRQKHIALSSKRFFVLDISSLCPHNIRKAYAFY